MLVLAIMTKPKQMGGIKYYGKISTSLYFQEPTITVLGKLLLTGYGSGGDLLTPDDSFVVSATSPLGKIPSANQTLLCSLVHNPRVRLTQTTS